MYICVEGERGCDGALTVNVCVCVCVEGVGRCDGTLPVK